MKKLRPRELRSPGSDLSWSPMCSITEWPTRCRDITQKQPRKIDIPRRLTVPEDGFGCLSFTGLLTVSVLGPYLKDPGYILPLLFSGKMRDYKHTAFMCL